MTGRLSTCGTCGRVIEYVEGIGWRHPAGAPVTHRADPDDGAVSGPSFDDLDPIEAATAEAHEYGLDDDEVAEHVEAARAAVAAGEPVPRLGNDGPCEWCPSLSDTCLSSCGCPSCEGQRALDDDADGYAERCRD